MLVLTRKKSESIQIGEDIKIKVLDVSGRSVSIGIEAPKDKYKIDRTDNVKKRPRRDIRPEDEE